eukprot:TRINITY_DN106949_c0_g1_i1.p1 TRINITY_DN106949_c0_g1~~TRINITY_DN106949_c0_g1_i1.p1  ORF type:complete len:511 (-),score=94.82 TRINITY_DN106949_c0_g1_i1:134-1597(-)
MDAALFTSRLLGAALEDYVDDCLYDEFVHDAILVDPFTDDIDASLLRPAPPPVPVNKTAQAVPRRPAARHVRQQGPMPTLPSATTAPPEERLWEPEEESMPSTEAPSETASEVEAVPKAGTTKFENALAQYMSCLFQGVLGGAARVFDAPMAMDQELKDVEEDVAGPLLPSAYDLGACSRPAFSNKLSLPPSAVQPSAEQLPADCLLLSSLVAQSLPWAQSTEPIDCNEEHCTSTCQKEQSYSELLHPESMSGETSFGKKSPVPPCAPRGSRRPGRVLDSSVQTCAKEENSSVFKGLTPQPPSAPRISQAPGRRPQRSAACSAPKQGDAIEVPTVAVHMATGLAQQQIQTQQQLKPVLVPPRAASLHSRPQSRQSLAGGSARHRGSSARTAMELDLEGEVTAPTSVAGPWLSMPAAPASMSTTAQMSTSPKMFSYKVSVDAGRAGISFDSKSPRFLPSINQKGRNAPGASANWSIGAEETWRCRAVA